MAESPNKSEKDVISFKILSGGSQITDAYQVKKISVDYKLNVITTATISLIDGDVAKQDFEAANSNDFVPGTEIEIQAGYDGDDSTIFKGIVVKMGISFDSGSGSVLEISCSDKAVLMTQARKSAYFLKVKDSDIISNLIANHSGLSSDVESTNIEHDELIQYDATDWDFMMVRADVCGLVVSIHEGKISVKKPDTTSTPVLTVTYGMDLIEFEADLNAADQTPAVNAFSWDSTTQKIVSSSGIEPSVSSIGNKNGKDLAKSLGVDDEILLSSAQIDEESLKVWANTKLLKTRLASLTGSATFAGSSLPRLNSIIEIKGVGERFSGNALISQITHTISDGQWITQAHFGMDEDWFAAKPKVNSLPAGGLTPKINGLMIGKVKQLDKDPNNENRILVTLPMMQDDSNSVWARMSTFYATNEKGTFFIPEIDDEVVLGFLNSDPNFPIILGSLYSSKIPPPYELTADNFIKAFVTKNECKIEFDDEKKIITLQTPGKNEIIISDDAKGVTIKDENDNSIITDTKGITIKDCNQNEIVMSSSGIEIKSNSNIKVTSSGGDVTISGLNVTNAAQMAMKASGQATAEFSAGGQTVIKGAIVMIN